MYYTIEKTCDLCRLYLQGTLTITIFSNIKSIEIGGDSDSERLKWDLDSDRHNFLRQNSLGLPRDSHRFVHKEQNLTNKKNYIYLLFFMKISLYYFFADIRRQTILLSLHFCIL